MERLNEIMARTAQQAQRRQRIIEQQSTHQKATGADAQPTYRGGDAGDHNGRPYAPRPRVGQEPQFSSTSDHYQVDGYSAQADVVEEWEDDATAMCYGDWENDEPEVQSYEVQSHVVPRTELPRGAKGHGRPQGPSEAPPASLPHPPSPPSLRHTRVLPPLSSSEVKPYLAQTPRELQRSSTPLSSPQSSRQEVMLHQRTTQPLHPRSTLRMSQDMPQSPPPRIAKPIQQVVVPEQATQSIPAPYRAPLAACHICKGAGYLRIDVPFGHPNFGKPIACECKDAERKEKRHQQLRSMSNLDAFHDKSFKTFNPRVPGVQEAFRAAVEYAKSPDGWLLLIGPNGCGKTHLAAAIANQSLHDGALVLFAVVPDLLFDLRATFAPTSPQAHDQLFTKMREAEMLVLDDLGAQRSSPWASETLFQLLNYRYNLGFPTVITSNLQGLQGIDDRIRSRMTDHSLVTVVKFERAQDYRPHSPRRV